MTNHWRSTTMKSRRFVNSRTKQLVTSMTSNSSVSSTLRAPNGLILPTKKSSNSTSRCCSSPCLISWSSSLDQWPAGIQAVLNASRVDLRASLWATVFPVKVTRAEVVLIWATLTTNQACITRLMLDQDSLWCRFLHRCSHQFSKFNSHHSLRWAKSSVTWWLAIRSSLQLCPRTLTTKTRLARCCTSISTISSAQRLQRSLVCWSICPLRTSSWSCRTGLSSKLVSSKPQSCLTTSLSERETWLVENSKTKIKQNRKYSSMHANK